MKKILSVVLAAVMLLAVCTASAAELAAEVYDVYYDEATSVTFQLPEGYELKETDMVSQMLTATAEGEDGTQIILVAGVDEEYSELEKLNDLTDEELEQYIYSLIEDWSDASYEVRTTDYDTKFVLIEENGAEIDACQLIGIYKGFTLAVYVVKAEGAQITEADHELALKVMSEVWVVDAE